MVCILVSVNGQWSDWSDWSVCSMTCGTGMKKRSRSCSEPTPTQLGLNCDGDTNDYNLCFNEYPCPSKIGDVVFG